MRVCEYVYVYFFPWSFDLNPGHDLPLRGFAITFRHITRGGAPQGSDRSYAENSYLTTRNNHKRKTSMPPAGFELTTPQTRGRRPFLYCAATAIGMHIYIYIYIYIHRHIYTHIYIYIYTDTYIHIYIYIYIYIHTHTNTHTHTHTHTYIYIYIYRQSKEYYLFISR